MALLDCREADSLRFLTQGDSFLVLWLRLLNTSVRFTVTFWLGSACCKHCPGLEFPLFTLERVEYLRYRVFGQAAGLENVTLEGCLR